MEIETTTSSILVISEAIRKRKMPERFEPETNYLDFFPKSKLLKNYNQRKYNRTSKERTKIQNLVTPVSTGRKNSDRFTALTKINKLKNPLLPFPISSKSSLRFS